MLPVPLLVHPDAGITGSAGRGDSSPERGPTLGDRSHSIPRTAELIRISTTTGSSRPPIRRGAFRTLESPGKLATARVCSVLARSSHWPERTISHSVVFDHTGK